MSSFMRVAPPPLPDEAGRPPFAVQTVDSLIASESWRQANTSTARLKVWEREDTPVSEPFPRAS
ncbi:MAG TPA: hypothetical protein PKM60_02605 [Zoogloea sp.]|nr:hypothetical protein [Zoogloea sp.]